MFVIRLTLLSSCDFRREEKSVLERLENVFVCDFYLAMMIDNDNDIGVNNNKNIASAYSYSVVVITLLVYYHKVFIILFNKCDASFSR